MSKLLVPQGGRDKKAWKCHENPSADVILRDTKDDAAVEYALIRSMSPTLVSDYTLRLPDKKLLRDKLRELTDLALEAGENEKKD